jgi:phospholipase C
VAGIEHVFVLMLENRSFDHLLGASPITGIDAVTGRPTQTNGAPAGSSNSWGGTNFPFGPPAVDPLTKDPQHEFPDVVEQLCGDGVTYTGGAYPPMNNSGFAANFGKTFGAPIAGNVMKCFNPGKVPVLSALAKEFALCDAWFSSLPGPTWPNRFFALGGSAAGLDHSPTTPETLRWETIGGFTFQNGSIFDVKNLKWRIYAGNKIFTLAHAIKGIHIWDIQRYKNFAKDVNDPSFDAQFIWIEPNYGHVTSTYLGGNSQHPLDGVTGGEALIRATYETIRSSPIWEQSLFVIVWDEHGGFYDHVPPPAAIPPGDAAQFSGANTTGFRFDQYGVRVPAVVISPLIPQNTIDHRLYDHASVLSTVERSFGLNGLTARDRGANDLLGLASLPAARTVAANLFALPAAVSAEHQAIPLDTLDLALPPPLNSTEPIESERSLPGFLYVAARTDKELTPPGVTAQAHDATVEARVPSISTRGDAHNYFEEVRRKAAAADAASQ